MFTIWASDCFLREFHTPKRCEGFVLFPGPEIFGSVWLFLCAATSTFLIFYVRCLSRFPGFRVVLRHLLKKTYFWEIVVTLILVFVYDLLAVLHDSKTSVIIEYVLFMAEESLAVAAVLFLNFLPSVRSDLSQDNFTQKLVIYKTTFLLYALEGYTMAILGTIGAVYNVLNVRTSVQGYSTKNPPGMEVVVDVVLLMCNNALRYFLGKFFFSKFFDRDTDILGGGTESISESLALNRADNIPTAGDAAQETQEASAHVEVCV